MSKTGNLEVRAEGERGIVITREFRAARRLVYRALTEANLLAQWLVGPPGWETTVCRHDVRPGGTYEHGWSDPDGAAMTMRGTYREVVENERLVHTETFEGCGPQAGEQIVETVFTEIDPTTTRVTSTVEYPTTDARDAALASGMTEGIDASYTRLDEQLEGESPS